MSDRGDHLMVCRPRRAFRSTDWAASTAPWYPRSMSSSSRRWRRPSPRWWCRSISTAATAAARPSSKIPTGIVTPTLYTRKRTAVAGRLRERAVRRSPPSAGTGNGSAVHLDVFAVPSETQVEAGVSDSWNDASRLCCTTRYGTVTDQALVSPDSKPSAYPGVFAQPTSADVGGKMERPGPPPALRQVTGRARRPS